MKKTLLLTLIFLLMLLLPTACSGNKNPDNDSNADSNVSVESGTADTNMANDATPEKEETKTEKDTDKESHESSLSVIELNKDGEFENDAVHIKFIGYKIIDIPALREGHYADRDPSFSYYLELEFQVTNKMDKRVKGTLGDRSVNDTIFVEQSYSFNYIDALVNYTIPIQFDKKDEVVLDPAAIEKVKIHFIMYDEDKGSKNYLEDPYFEAYLVFNTPQ